jgi:chemotaxis protein MotB
LSSSPSGRRDRRRALLLPEPPPIDEDQTAWLLTFSDLVLQLFAFVLVAVVLGNPKPSMSHPAPDPMPPAEWPVVQAACPEPTIPVGVVAEEPLPAPPAAPPPEALRERIESEVQADGVTVTVRDSDVVLALSDRISFPSGSADLLPAARPLLARIATLAAALPERSIEVAGHTDDVPIHTGAFPSNLELSLARAARVVRELAVASPGLDGRMIATGFGEHRPVVPNEDAASRAQNRRVEIRFISRGRERSGTS